MANSADDVIAIRQLIAENPGASRRRLSEKLCEAWQWKQANGALRDMVCRGLLLMLHRTGEIELPPIRFQAPNPFVRRATPAPMLIDTTPIASTLREFHPVELQQVRRTGDEPLFNSLMEQHYYLKYEQPVGEHLKYLAWAQGRPIACLAWSSAPRHLGSRDRYIGWSAEARRIVSMVGAWTVALFFTGWKHAGENLAEVLKQRARELPAPIQMSGALSRNSPKVAGVEPLQANCLAHGRRQVVEVADNFPEECRYVLETLRDVHHYDAQARERAMSPEQRLRFHQEHSEPLMKGLHEWMKAQLAEHKTEPNSGLGKAISYLLNHWPKLTLFLRQAGAPIDNNIVERALKKAILNRKNALFYKTLNGARVGDLFMSLIHTCELNNANPFDYLTELQKHSEEMKQKPSEWMPWNYRERLARLAAPAAA